MSEGDFPVYRADGWWTRDGGLSWHHPAPNAEPPLCGNAATVTVAIGAGAMQQPTGEQLCICKDRALSKCPGEWEQGCDLGANEKFVRVAP